MQNGKSFKEILEFLTVSEDDNNVFNIKEGHIITLYNRTVEDIEVTRNGEIQISCEDDGPYSDPYIENINTKLNWVIYKQI
jgi:hypothetical protein